MPENIEQVYRGRLGTLCSANIDHRYHHSICLFIFKERQPDGTSPSTDHSHLSSPLFTSLHTILQIRMQSSTSPEIPTQSDDETGQVLLFHNPANPHVILNLH